MQINEAIDIIEKVPGFDDETTAVGEAFMFLINYIGELEEELAYKDLWGQV